jgi:sarcosine oxidase
VIGGGVIGAASAWAMARRGLRVGLFEQFTPGHSLGASHGRARIFRLAYPDQLYVRFAQSAQPLWRELEAETGAQLLTLTGAVDHGDPTVLSALSAALTEAGESADLLPASTARRNWPGMRFGGPVLHHRAAGRLDADAAVGAFTAAARQWGADIGHPVTVDRIELRGVTGVELHTDVGRISAGQVVVAAGGWTSHLLAGLPGWRLPPLRLTQEQPAVFAPLGPATQWPSFIHHPLPGTHAAPATGGVYGMGGVEGVKVGFHGVGPVVSPADRAHDAARTDPAALSAVQAYARSWLPGVDVGSAVAQTCTYNSTPDGDFVIDRIGAVTVAAGFSGHGFKFAPAVGELVADLVQGTADTPKRWSNG